MLIDLMGADVLKISGIRFFSVISVPVYHLERTLLLCPTHA
jgi:hypothetical protein